ncbi:phosphoribosylanthranilate isomerase [candidate division KSB1 bacterium]
MRTKVKICGITCIDDAQAAIDAGADALGFMFYEESPRFIEVDTARNLAIKIPPHISKIGVFVNADLRLLDRLDEGNFLDYFQFSGDENPSICTRYADRTIKTFHIQRNFKIESIDSYNSCAMYLFDSGSPESYGGTGETFDWSVLTTITIKKDFILAGGLDEFNVGSAITAVNPFMVDVSSGVERSPGKKDHEKIARFIQACRKADSARYSTA